MTDGEQGESLIQWIGRLLCDVRARDHLAADPVGVLTEHGLVDLDPTDVHHALVLVAETVGLGVDVLAVPAVPTVLAAQGGVAVPHRAASSSTGPTERLRCPARDVSRRNP